MFIDRLELWVKNDEICGHEKHTEAMTRGTEEGRA
jgi:hypothetical protein